MPAGMLSRLDYIITPKPAQRMLIPQHMRTRFRHLSDHWSLEADLHRFSKACTPSMAVRLATIPETPSGLRLVPTHIEFDGSYQWIYVEQQGTYTVFPPTVPVEVAIFKEDSLSTQRAPFDKADALSLGLGPLDSELHQYGVSPEGEQYEVPGPFFIRLRARKRVGGYVGQCVLAVLRHRG